MAFATGAHRLGFEPILDSSWFGGTTAGPMPPDNDWKESSPPMSCCFGKWLGAVIRSAFPGHFCQTSGSNLVYALNETIQAGFILSL